jgi:hypothetical protein
LSFKSRTHMPAWPTASWASLPRPSLWPLAQQRSTSRPKSERGQCPLSRTLSKLYSVPSMTFLFSPSLKLRAPLLALAGASLQFSSNLSAVYENPQHMVLILWLGSQSCSSQNHFLLIQTLNLESGYQKRRYQSIKVPHATSEIQYRALHT